MSRYMHLCTNICKYTYKYLCIYIWRSKGFLDSFIHDFTNDCFLFDMFLLQN